MKAVSSILAVALLASTAASAVIKLPARDALSKAPRWVNYITYDGQVTCRDQDDTMANTAQMFLTRRRRLLRRPAAGSTTLLMMVCLSTSLHRYRLIHIQDVEDESSSSKKERRWVNYITYDGNFALTRMTHLTTELTSIDVDDAASAEVSA